MVGGLWGRHGGAGSTIKPTATKEVWTSVLGAVLRNEFVDYPSLWSNSFTGERVHVYVFVFVLIP